MIQSYQVQILIRVHFLPLVGELEPKPLIQFPPWPGPPSISVLVLQGSLLGRATQPCSHLWYCHSHPITWLLLSYLLYRGTERLSNLPQVTQLVSPELQTQQSGSESIHHPHPFLQTTSGSQGFWVFAAPFS